MSFIYRIGVLTRHVISGSSSPLHRCILHLSNENIKKNDDPSGSVNKEVSIQFLQAMRNVPSPVVVVTTGNGVIKRGVTCSSFTSVSSIPPIISFCMKKPSRMHQLLLDTKRFAVHVLSEKQVHHSIHFSKPIPDNEEQFKEIPHSVSSNNLPLLPNCSVVINCSAYDVHSIGDHHVWYGHVQEVTHSNQDEPLLYYARSYRSIGDHSFMKSFETATLAYEDWTHEAHLRMAWNYLIEYEREEATPLIKEGIQKFNEKNSDKITRGYHETITTFFIHMICQALDQMKDKNHSFEEFLDFNGHLKDSRLLFKYYSHETINTVDAKKKWIEPDLKDLP